jgi:hypothetical protein
MTAIPIGDRPRRAINTYSPAVIVERLSGEAAVERLQFQASDIEEPEPLVLGRPPQ